MGLDSTALVDDENCRTEDPLPEQVGELRSNSSSVPDDSTCRCYTVKILVTVSLLGQTIK